MSLNRVQRRMKWKRVVEDRKRSLLGRRRPHRMIRTVRFNYPSKWIAVKNDWWNWNDLCWTNGSTKSRRISCPTLKWTDWMPLLLFNSSWVSPLNSPRRKSTKSGSIIYYDDSSIKWNSSRRRRPWSFEVLRMRFIWCFFVSSLFFSRWSSKFVPMNAINTFIYRSSLLNNYDERIFSIIVSLLFNKSSNIFKTIIQPALLCWRWKNKIFLFLICLHSSTNNLPRRLLRLDIVNIPEISLIVIQNC